MKKFQSMISKIVLGGILILVIGVHYSATALADDSTTPSIPVNVSANASAYNEVDLSWDPSTETSGTIAGYYVLSDEGTDGASYTNLTPSGITTTTYSDLTTNANTTYSYEVEAYDTSGNTSSPSSPTVATTPANPNSDTTTSTDQSDQSSSTDSSPSGDNGSTNSPTSTDPTTDNTSPTDTTCPTSTDPTDPNSTDPTTTNSSDGSDTNNTVLNNQTDSCAQSGDANVDNNTSAGNATSGDAQVLANILNILESSDSLGSGGLQTFVQNIMGNVDGNLTIDPATLAQLLSNYSSDDPNQNVDLTAQNSGVINNTVDLDAASGDASVEDNGTGGDATTGDATAVANIINLIDSIMSAEQSFIGVINIYGNLDGNILVPSDFYNSLLDSNTPSTTLNNGSDGNTNIDTTNNDAINNQVTTTATSGDATVSDNSLAGNATTGTATTQVTIFNLTGEQIIGSNALLVFVNVLGTWVGMILNAPGGSTAALLGGGISQDTQPTGNTNVSSTNNDSINNDITTTATSGNATVANNGIGGNATSGNASASVNLLNIVDSQFSLSNWFGILFINVFGSWYGNFGVATDPTPPTVQVPNTTTNDPVQTAAIVRPAKTLGLGGIVDTALLATSPVSTTGGQVLGQAISSPDSNGAPKITSIASHGSFNWLIAAVGILIGILLLVTERVLSKRKNTKKNAE